MASNNILNISEEKAQEMPMVDMAFELLRLKKESMTYKDIMGKIAEIKGFTQDDINRVIAQLYTQMNIDGRFLLKREDSEYKWGLRRWYVFSLDDSNNSIHVFDDDDEDDYEEVEEEEQVEAEADEFDSAYSEDAEDMAADEVQDEVEGIDASIEDEEIDEELEGDELDEETEFDPSDEIAIDDEEDEV